MAAATAAREEMEEVRVVERDRKDDSSEKGEVRSGGGGQKRFINVKAQNMLKGLSSNNHMNPNNTTNNFILTQTLKSSKEQQNQNQDEQTTDERAKETGTLMEFEFMSQSTFYGKDAPLGTSGAVSVAPSMPLTIAPI